MPKFSEEEKDVLAAVTFNMRAGPRPRRYRGVLTKLIKRGLVERVTIYQLTRAGRKALRTP